MKKLFSVALAVGLLVALALPALAQSTIPPGQDPDVCDLSFDVDVTKVKNIEINKEVNKNFNYDLNLEVSIIGLPQWAEVEAFKCDHNEDNQVQVFNTYASADNIINSFNSFAGISQVNQGAGILNNQGNIVAAGLTSNPTGEFPTQGLSMVEVAVEKSNINNVLVGVAVATLDSIASSFNLFSGLAQVNQAAGFLNNQDNVLALAKNLNGIGLVAENDTFLSMSNSENRPLLSGQCQTNAQIDSSFNSFSGVAQVNQAPGMLNNQCNIISIANAGP